ERLNAPDRSCRRGSEVRVGLDAVGPIQTGAGLVDGHAAGPALAALPARKEGVVGLPDRRRRGRQADEERVARTAGPAATATAVTTAAAVAAVTARARTARLLTQRGSRERVARDPARAALAGRAPDPAGPAVAAGPAA